MTEKTGNKVYRNVPAAGTPMQNRLAGKPSHTAGTLCAIPPKIGEAMEIEKATYEDLSKILDLQKLAYLSEAKLVNDYSIQPLTQTLEELEKEFSKGIILKIENTDTNETIASVRTYEENDRVYIGKLIVHPEYQNRGIGTNLLKTIETYYKNKTFELFTSNKSEKNISLYKKNGYNEYKREKVSENMELIFMEKTVI